MCTSIINSMCIKWYYFVLSSPRVTCQRDVGSLPAAHVTSPPEVLLSPLPWVYGVWGWKGGEGGIFVLILSFSDNVRNLFLFCEGVRCPISGCLSWQRCYLSF